MRVRACQQPNAGESKPTGRRLVVLANALIEDDKTFAESDLMA